MFDDLCLYSGLVILITYFACVFCFVSVCLAVAIVLVSLYSCWYITCCLVYFSI